MENDNSLEELSASIREVIGRSGGSAPLSDDQFNELVLRVFAFQFDRNLPYRALATRQGKTPDSVKDFRGIPAIVTSAFKDLDLTVLPASERSALFHSSGTTAEKRSRHFHSIQTLQLYEQSLVSWFIPHLLPTFRHIRMLSLTPRPAEAPHSSLVHMMGTIASLLRGDTAPVFAGVIAPDESWTLDVQAVQLFAGETAAAGEPALICGTAFSFVHLCDWLQENKKSLPLPPGSRVFETGGYKGRSRVVAKEELHRMIQTSLDVPDTHIVSEYGMSELSSQAYDRRAGESEPRRLRFPPWTRWEIISPETGSSTAEGETGLLRVYDLANLGSVMAVQTEDLAMRCCDGFVLQGRAAAAEARGCSLMHV